MKRIVMMMGAVLLATGAVHAADVSAGVDFATAYVFRGVTLNNGAVMQPGAEISGFPVDEKFGSFAAGIWANYDINAIDSEGSDVSEIDYYLSYSLPLEQVDVSLTYLEYTYPEAGGNSDKEISLSLGTALGTNGLYTSVSFNYGVGGAIEGELYVQGGLDYEVALTESLSATAGVTVGYLQDDDGPSGFNDATASVGLGYALNDTWSLGGGLTYVAQLDDEVLTDAEYDVNVLATFGVSCSF